MKNCSISISEEKDKIDGAELDYFPVWFYIMSICIIIIYRPTCDHAIAFS